MWWVIGSGAIFVLVALRAILLAVRLNRRTGPLGYADRFGRCPNRPDAPIAR